MNDLANVFILQNKLFDINFKYVNEFETMKMLHTKHPKLSEQLAVSLLDSLDHPQDVRSAAECSRRLREEGNRIFKASGTDNREGILNACRLYTKAIIEAECAHKELGLAYANRAMALQKYGFYREAYDDCVCALEFEYPRMLQHKLIMRQAFCSWKMGKVKQMGEHVKVLEAMQLNENFKNQLEELQQCLLTEASPPVKQIDEQPAKNLNLHRIVDDVGSRGRYMIASKNIKQGELIFTEHADCFVPIEQRLICYKCCKSQLIPIPCPYCHKRIVYCSRLCRQLDADVHRFECAGFRRNLFHMVGVSHLACHLVVTYLPQLMPSLQTQASASQLWQSLVSLTSAEKHSESVTTQCTQTLGLITHLHKMPREELIYHMQCANLLQFYLYNNTNFFQYFDTTAASRKDWQIIVAAFILRSVGQLLANGHVGDAIMTLNAAPNEFTLLQPSLWQQPYHLKCGHLHKLADIKLVAAINLPLLSLCNHACAPSIRTVYDGCLTKSYAIRDINEGDEIFNCYTVDYKNTLVEKRHKQLAHTFQFKCSCEKCTRSNPDQDYLQFYRYRCEEPQCRQTFVPRREKGDLSWWSIEGQDEELRCSACGSVQDLGWFYEFLILLESCNNESTRNHLYELYEHLNYWLVDNHMLKQYLALLLIKKCYSLLIDGCILNSKDYEQLSRIVQFKTKATELRFGKYSIEYVTTLTYLLDLIAWGKYKCDASEARGILNSLEFISSEYKNVIENYINDFIGQLYVA